MRAVGWFPANNLGNAASGRDYIGARPFAREESESAKDPFKPLNCLPFLGYEKWEALLWLETLCTTSV